MRINCRKYITLVTLLLSVSAMAGSAKWSPWYISQTGQKVAFPNSIAEVQKDKNFALNKNWTIGKRCKMEPTKLPMFAITTVEADSDYRQDIAFDGGGIKELRLNGKKVDVLAGANFIYLLHLKKGTNTIAFQVGTENGIKSYLAQHKKNKRVRRPAYCGGNLRITYPNLEYIAPSLELKIANTRLAITQLGRQFRRSYDSKGFLAQLKKLEESHVDEATFEKFRYQALVLSNPFIKDKFSKILFRSSGSANMPVNWRGNSHYLYNYSGPSSSRFGGQDEIKTLDLTTGKTSTVYKAANDLEGVMDICLDYSGDKLLYSGIDTEKKAFEVYEINVDGTGKRQVTPSLPTVDNYNGIYLPNGKILFCSTASMNSVPCVNGLDRVGVLYEVNADGTGMRQVAFDQENDWYPWVKDNGRVMYSRWEYTDNAHYFTRNLLEMNPDGTNNRAIYGSNSFWPNTMFYAKQIPGHTSMFSAIVSGHHGTSRAGELIIFDGSKGDFEADGVIQRIPGRGRKVEPVVVDNYMGGKYPRFLHPFPLSKEYYLVSAQFTPNSKWALYLVDTFDNMIKLADSDRQMFEPVPLMARQRPPVIPDKRRLGEKDATLFIQDIYAGPGLKGVPRGTVKYLRIFTYGYAYRYSGGHDALAIEGPWDTKRILGTVPFEEDGSLMVKIPANLPLSLQPLDENGQAIQLMKSWTYAQQGEVLSCVGCHESPNTTPLTRQTIASNKPPQKLTPWSKYKKTYGFGFKREIQPVLDKYCIGCHDGSKKDLPNFADITEDKWQVGRGAWGSTPHFGRSYLALHPFVHRPGPESDMHLFNPYEFHASTSELMQILNKGHHGVKLDKRSKEQLASWIDLNVPYHATWTESENSPKMQDYAETTRKYKALYSGLEDDNIEWMPSDPIERPEFVIPDMPEVPDPVKLKGWPLADNSVKRETKDIIIGDQKITFVRIPKGKFVMGSTKGSEDEYPEAVVEVKKPFWISTKEITNAQFNAYDPKHDSKSIDQQWKDHVYAGYPAYKPEMPVIRVSWQESMAFCKWLSEKSGQNITLPTESQWEWAARAGSDQPFFFGTTGFENYCNLADQSIALLAVRGINPKPVPASQRTPLNDFVPRDMSFNDKRLTPDGTGQYKPNAWGLYDMIGNVAEWTRSSYKPYPYKDDDGRNDLSIKDQKVVRGGSWRDRPKRATSSYRVPYASYQKVFNVGFRIIIED